MLFKAGDLGDLKQKLLSLLSLDTLNLKSREAEYYEKNYNSKAIRKQLLTIYNSVIQK
jgi:glycosyltransferase family 4 protein